MSKPVPGWRAGKQHLARSRPSYREATKLLADLAGVHVGSETLRTQAERIGTELEAEQRAAMDCVEDGTPAELRPVVVLGDGAKWIWEHVATLFGDERTEIVDWYHATEHLWTAAKALHDGNA